MENFVQESNLQHIAAVKVPAAQEKSKWDSVMADPELYAEFCRRVGAAVQEASASADGDMKNEVEKLRARIERYERREAALKAGADEAFVDYVIFEAQNRMSGEVGFEQAVAMFLKEKPQFSAENTRKGAWGSMQKGEPYESRGGVEAAFSALNPNLKF